jgi:hypothetical protein
MKFTGEEKKKLLGYVAKTITKDCGLPISESQKIVSNSILVDKIETSPLFIAHCSMGQLSDMVKKEKHLMCL